MNQRDEDEWPSRGRRRREREKEEKNGEVIKQASDTMRATAQKIRKRKRGQRWNKI